jgi:uncharacterized membrane protein
VNLHRLIGHAADALEALGVGVLVAAVVVAAGRVLWRARASGWHGSFHQFRVVLGRGILLGLEFLVAADIIRTVTEELVPSKVLSLGVIVLIRTFLSVMLEVELEGRLPWHRHRHQAVRNPGADDFAGKE